MDKIIQHLQSNEVLVKTKGLEELLEKLNRKVSLNSLQGDTKLRLINTTVMSLKDANPKIVLTAMECVKIFFDQYGTDFQPLVNMTFDILLTKFGDGKVHSYRIVPDNVTFLQLSVRARANETMVELINSIGLAAGYEKLEVHRQEIEQYSRILPLTGTVHLP